MYKSLFIFLIFLSQWGFSQEQLWERKTGGKQADFLSDGLSTVDYGFLLGGSSLSDVSGIKNSGSYDYLLTKYSEDGAKEWSKIFGGKDTDLLQRILLDYDGGYLLGGISRSGKGGLKTGLHIGGFDIWLVKLDLYGNLLWQKTLGGMADEQLGDIIRTPDGGYLIGGSSSSGELLPVGKKWPGEVIVKEQQNYGNADFWVVKLDAQGNFLWQKSYGGARKDLLKNILALPGGGYLLAGISNSLPGGNKTAKNKGGNDWWIIKTDSSGNIEWQKSFGDDAEDVLSKMIFTRDKGILLGGYYVYIDPESNKNKADMVLRKIDLDGNLLWKEIYTATTDDYLVDLLQNKDGSLILGSYSASRNKNKKSIKKGDAEDYLLIKTDEQGQELWRVKAGGPEKEVLKKIIMTRDGGYVLMGSRIGGKSGRDMSSDFYMVKIGDKDKPQQKKFPLEAIPNPAVLYTQAVIGNDYEKGRFRLIDLNGKVLQEKELKGEKIVPVNMSYYPNGVYIINIRVDDYSNSTKVIKSAH